LLSDGEVDRLLKECFQFLTDAACDQSQLQDSSANFYLDASAQFLQYASGFPNFTKDTIELQKRVVTVLTMAIMSYSGHILPEVQKRENVDVDPDIFIDPREKMLSIMLVLCESTTIALRALQEATKLLLQTCESMKSKWTLSHLQVIENAYYLLSLTESIVCRVLSMDGYKGEDDLYF